MRHSEVHAGESREDIHTTSLTTLFVSQGGAFEGTIDSLEDSLESDGLTIDPTQASTFTEALEILRSQPINCVITEQSLDEGTGLDLLEESRRYGDEPAFILCPKEHTPGLPSDAIDAGVTQYVSQHTDDIDGKLQDILLGLANVQQSDAPTEEHCLNRPHGQEPASTATLECIGGMGTIQYDISNDSFEASSGAKQMFDITEPEKLGLHSALSLCHPVDRKEVEQTLTRCALRKTQESQIFRVQHNSLRHLELHCVPVVNSEGRVVKIRGIIQNISDEREYQQDLEELQGVEGIGIVQGLPLQDDLWWSQGVYEILNVPVEDGPLTFEEYLELIPEEDRDKPRKALQEVMSQDTVSLEHRVEVDGEIRWVKITIRLQNQPELGGLEIVGILEDITEEKERQYQLESARTRYQSVINAVPDPIILADRDTGIIEEANPAANDQLGVSLTNSEKRIEEIFTPEDPETYRQFLDSNPARRGVTELPGGSPLKLQPVSGDPVSISLSTELVEDDDDSYLLAICRDISDAAQYERSMLAVNEFARDALDAQDEQEISDLFVEKSKDVLDMLGPAVALFDHEENVLSPVSTPGNDTELEEVEFEPGASIAWRVYQENGFEALDDVRKDPDCMNPNTRFRSELHAAIGSHGILIAGDTEPDSITDVERRTMRLMARTMEAALDRVSRVQRLETQEQEVDDRREEISRLDELNEQVRRTLQNTISSRTHSEIDFSVCDSLTGGAIVGAWISNSNYAEEKLEVQDASGDVEDYLSRVSFALDDENSPPTTSAFATRSSIVESNVGRNVQHHEWRRCAVETGISSIVSVPVIYDDVLYGILTVALSDTAFLQERIVDFLEDLSRVVGYAHYAVTQRNSLTASSEIDLVIDFLSSDHPLVQLSQHLDAEITVNSVTNISSERFSAFVDVGSSCYVDELEELSEQSSILEDVRTVANSGTTTVQLDVRGTTPLAHVINLGAQLNVAEATSDSVTLDISLSRDKDAQQFMNRVRNLYTDVSVTAHRESKSSSSPFPAGSPAEALTEGQEEILDTAVRTGYFDIPRQTSLSELGSLVGISQNAASERMRRAQSTVLEMLFD